MNANLNFSLLSIILLTLSFFTGCSDSNKYNSIDGIIWNTSYHIIYKGNPELQDSILKTLEMVDQSLNFFNDNSLLTKVNNHLDSVNIDSHFIQVYDFSKKINVVTKGMFDPTLSPLITAWGFAKGHRPTSDTLKIDSLLSHTGIMRTHRINSVLYKDDADITFNFSAIAKGYGCDQVAEMLKRNGVTDYLVEIGGEINLSGVNPENKIWNISIDSPDFDSLAGNHKSQIILQLTDCGIATSGNYRNFHETKGKKFGHTISPLTGRPIITDILSATIIAPTAMEADAVATAAMTLGSKQSLTLCDSLGYAAYFILSDAVISNAQFKSLISQ